jgi:ribosomal protein L14E/L6E/L27E
VSDGHSRTWPKARRPHLLYIGPVKMPIKLPSGKIDIFNFYYFEIKKRYVVISKGVIKNSENVPMRLFLNF